MKWSSLWSKAIGANYTARPTKIEVQIHSCRVPVLHPLCPNGPIADPPMVNRMPHQWLVAGIENPHYRGNQYFQSTGEFSRHSFLYTAPTRCDTFVKPTVKPVAEQR